RRGNGKASLARGERLAYKEKRHRRALEDRVVGDAIDIQAEVELVTAVRLVRSEREIRDSLPAASANMGSQVVAARHVLGVRDKWPRTLVAHVATVLIEVESEIEKLTTTEINLIASGEKVAAFGIPGCAGLRTED